jgi:hypothetical protein
MKLDRNFFGQTSAASLKSQWNFQENFGKVESGLVRRTLRTIAESENMTKSVVSTIAILLIFGACFVYGADPGQPPSGPPVVSEAKFDPPQPIAGQPIKLQVKLGGVAIRAEVQWSLNGEEVETSDYDGLGEPIQFSKKTTAGDKVSAVVTPYDPASAPGTKTKKEVVIGSAPPAVKVTDQKIVGNDKEGYAYTARVDAKDPQGGPITFAVIQAPEGLSVDSQGNVTWKVSEKVSGSFPVVISASDEKGAKTDVSFTVVLRWQKGK